MLLTQRDIEKWKRDEKRFKRQAERRSNYASFVDVPLWFYFPRKCAAEHGLWYPPNWLLVLAMLPSILGLPIPTLVDFFLIAVCLCGGVWGLLLWCCLGTWLATMCVFYKVYILAGIQIVLLLLFVIWLLYLQISLKIQSKDDHARHEAIRAELRDRTIAKIREDLRREAYQSKK